MEELLRAHDLRVTRPRLAVLKTVHEHPHADTNSIIEHVRTQLPEVSHQAIYDVLAALSTVGLLRRIQPQGSVARYEARVGDNHHHVVCRSCGAVADVDCATGSAPCLTASETHGYAIQEAEVIYWGLCPECLTASPPDRTLSTARSTPHSSTSHDSTPHSSTSHDSTPQSSTPTSPVPLRKDASV